MAVRRFVLEPLAEIAPEAVDPVTGQTVAKLLADLNEARLANSIGSSLVVAGVPLSFVHTWPSSALGSKNPAMLD